MTYSLRPINERSRKRRRLEDSQKIGVCDIESRDWENFVVIGYFDGSRFKHFGTLDDFFEHVFSIRGHSNTIFSHFGGRFDHLFLLNHVLFNTDFRVENIISRGSSILSFDAYYTPKKVLKTRDNALERKIKFADSSAFLPFSLKTLTENFQVTHKKGEIDYNKIKGITKELIAYLKSDCIGLYECIQLYLENPMIKEAGAAYTTASQAMRVFRTYLEEPLPSCPDNIENFVRRGYFGGRTEIFKPLFERDTEPLHIYDVNSLYPYVCRETEMPGAFDCLSDTLELERIGYIDCDVFVPEQYIPPLGFKYEKKGERKLLFPCGYFRGVFSTLELREAIKNHGVQIQKTYGAVYFRSSGFVFSEFIDSMYRLRKASPRGSVDDILAKLAMNSCYGRFALNKKREKIVFDEGQKGFKPIHTFTINGQEYRIGTEENILRTYTHAGIGAWITSAARVHMLGLYRKHSKELYYTDTDSIFTTLSETETDDLGGLKHECHKNGKCLDRACFLLPKTYIAEGTDFKKIAMKGMPYKKIQHFNFEDLKEALTGELMADKNKLKITIDDGLATFKRALQMSKVLTKKGLQTKAIKSKYNKRFIYKDNSGRYDSRAWFINKSGKLT